MREFLEMNKNKQRAYAVIRWLQSLKGIGNTKIKQMIRQSDQVNLLYEGTYEQLKTGEEGFNLSARFIVQNRQFESFEKIFEESCNNEIGIITFLDEAYPVELREISDSPVILYTKGNASLLDGGKKRTAIVGTRIPTEYGTRAVKDISRVVLSYNQVIVSGMAMGIDTLAHQVAIQEGKETIAVLGCGINEIYPKINEKLYRQIEKTGLLISEYPMNSKPNPRYFPERNRIISGISERCIVVEASAKSGSLITASYAADQNRTVYAVPGTIYAKQSQGCNELIATGAIPIVNVLQFEENLRWECGCEKIKKESENKKMVMIDWAEPILQVIQKNQASTLEDILEQTALPIGEVVAKLQAYEDEKIVKLIGFLYQLA